jgi:hypothetical protein
MQVGPWLGMLALIGLAAFQHEKIIGQAASCNATIAQNANALNVAAAQAQTELQNRLDAADAALAQAGQKSAAGHEALRASLPAVAEQAGNDGPVATVLGSAIGGLKLLHKADGQ